MKKCISIKQNTDFKYLNLYTATYTDCGKKYDYYIASRRRIEDLSVNGSEKVDAVRIIPYIKRNNKIYVVLINEFRHAIGDYIYSVPAGLIDDGETYERAAERELREEIGAEVISLDMTQKASYVSAGMTDEKLICYEAEVKLIHKQSLDENEDIKIKIVELDNLENFIEQNNFGLLDALQLKAFASKLALQKQRGQNEEDMCIHR